MASSDGSSSSGSAPPVGEVVTQATGGRPRTPKRGERVSGVTLDGTRSAEMAAHNAAALAAVADYNSGASDQQAGGISDPEGVLDRGRAPVVTGTCSDPSSLSRG
jgi:hypothetical protein